VLDAFEGRDWLMQEFKDRPFYLKLIDDMTKPRITLIAQRVEQFRRLRTLAAELLILRERIIDIEAESRKPCQEIK
jgi:hypothetical protein